LGDGMTEKKIDKEIAEVKRIKSGIPGFDELVGGGFIEGSINMVSGTTGSGKTIFCSQFLWQGLKQNEPGMLYASVEQLGETIIGDLKRLGMNFEPYIKSKKCVILDVLPSSFKDFSKLILEKISEANAKRFVLDSLSVLLATIKEFPEIFNGMEYRITPQPKIRRMLFNFTKKLKLSGVTSLFISEIPTVEPRALSRFGFEEFVADAVIVLRMFEYAGAKSPRSLQVIKMRGTKHSTDIHPFVIGKGGIRVMKPEKGVIV